MAKLVQLSRRKETPVRKLAIAVQPAETEATHLQSIKNDPLNARAYNRLMVIYRKSKETKKELAIINKAIRAFESFYHSNKKKQVKAVHNLSMKLSKSLGLTDQKGKVVYDMEPIRSWKKRKETVLKKLR